ncbi:MAG: leucyl aminopeptidase [Cyanobacteriota bacterium]|nr:leucyl aminopeptidase [Cyanobacteriota bacterium]
MEFRCISSSLAESIDNLGDQALAVGLFGSSDGPSPQPLLETLSERFGPELSARLQQCRFRGRAGDSTTLQLLGSEPSVLILQGLGKPEDLQEAGLRTAASAAARAAEAAGCTGLVLAFPRTGSDGVQVACSLAESVRLATYCDERFKSEPEASRPRLSRLSLVDVPDQASTAIERVNSICAGVELARQLVAAPPNVVTPQHLADQAAAIARDQGLELKLLERADCEQLGMGAYLGVAQGSELLPKFIHLTYRPDGEARRRVVLVGKGLTFDSGGYNLKTAGSQIEMMKYDMGGSAAVLGAALTIGSLKPEGVEVHVIVAACENMISGAAVHPGDILTASNGKTIEINNTDAEGRLTLADALVYASRLEPDAIVDLATLTGACVIALGEEIAGLWSSNDGLADALIKASQAGGEDLWRMPLRSSYKQGLKSPVADMKNTGPRPGGSITAALFLQDFVTEGLPWAHLDIAGTVWSEKGRGSDPAGATGFGVRTLVNWVCDGAPSGAPA